LLERRGRRTYFGKINEEFHRGLSGTRVRKRGVPMWNQALHAAAPTGPLRYSCTTTLFAALTFASLNVL
jgi:hypothetical protein